MSTLIVIWLLALTVVGGVWGYLMIRYAQYLVQELDKITMELDRR